MERKRRAPRGAATLQVHRRRLRLSEPSFDEPAPVHAAPHQPPDMLAKLLRLDPLVESLNVVYQAAVTAEAAPLPPPLAPTFIEAQTEALLDRKCRAVPAARPPRPSTSRFLIPVSEPARSVYLYQQPPAAYNPSAPVRCLTEPDALLPPWMRKDIPTAPLEVDARDYLMLPSLGDPPLSTSASVPRSADAWIMQSSRPLPQRIPVEGALLPSAPKCVEAFSALHNVLPQTPSPSHPPALTAEQRALEWRLMAQRDVPRAAKERSARAALTLALAKQAAQVCEAETRRALTVAMRAAREVPQRSRKLIREMATYWRKSDKEEKEARKKAEKEALEARKRDEEIQEAKRQQRKLNFLLTQTELYSHFIAKKNKPTEAAPAATTGGVVEEKLAVTNDAPLELAESAEEQARLRAEAEAKASDMVAAQNARIKSFDDARTANNNEAPQDDSLLNPASMPTSQSVTQPTMLRGQLKDYQLRGLNWLANLYEQGINGILADEMGLGKTVQALSLLCHLAEAKGIWGPFLVIAPTSTLFNWQNELQRFAPDLRILPYWGPERALLRHGWQRWKTQVPTKENAPFHVLITNYQLVVQDERYLASIRWQYMVLDEAQAIKSSSSARWATLLRFQCRNRLLLTGTPIQNSMAELWALLHFIMPTLFDSHAEFNEWFSRDIENQAESEHQLSRLHAILNPFMLRRVKKDVENEMAPKVEETLACDLTAYQKRLYEAIRNKISLADILRTDTTAPLSDAAGSVLMNLVMQFRKVCNHPELFELRHTTSSYCFRIAEAPVPRNPVRFALPKLLYRQSPLLALQHSGSIEGHCRSVLLLRFGPWFASHILHSTALQFLRLLDISPAEAAFLALSSLVVRALAQRVLSSRAHPALSELSLSLSRSLLIPPRSELPVSALRAAQSLFLHEFPLLSRVLYVLPKAVAPPPREVCSDRLHAIQEHIHFAETKAEFCGLRPLSTVYFTHGRSPTPGSLATKTGDAHSWTNSTQNLIPLRVPLPPVLPPPATQVIADSGKMRVLDTLLTQLKAGGHRVLLYSQMTRMIDILEGFMHLRHYRYVRLDGSSKLNDRRDMVDDFQKDPDIFVFLLSTRAGGLGINLTAADTVIFYDSDWNPTMDAQAMDRAHRLGQTKQVTVYRLICHGTIEERILKRALHKNTIQYKVIQKFHEKTSAQQGAEKEAEQPEATPLLISDRETSRVVAGLLLGDDELEETLLEKLKRRRGPRKKRAAAGEGEAAAANGNGAKGKKGKRKKMEEAVEEQPQSDDD